MLEKINILGQMIIFATRWHQLSVLSEMRIFDLYSMFSIPNYVDTKNYATTVFWWIETTGDMYKFGQQINSRMSFVLQQCMLGVTMFGIFEKK